MSSGSSGSAGQMHVKSQKTKITGLISARVPILGNGVVGHAPSATPTKAQSGGHPSRTSKSSRLAAGTSFLTRSLCSA